MSTPLETYEDVLAVIGTLPHLSPRPTAKNIPALVVDLVDKLTIIPLQQSPDFGYAGIIEADEIYSRKTQTPWQKWADLGPYCPINVTWTSDESKNHGVIYDAEKKVYNSQTHT